MQITYKAVLLGIIAVGLLVGLLLGRVADEAWGLLGLIVGYLTANGATAAKGEITLPALMPKKSVED